MSRARCMPPEAGPRKGKGMGMGMGTGPDPDPDRARRAGRGGEVTSATNDALPFPDRRITMTYGRATTRRGSSWRQRH
jgi:hypothetical protein